MKFPNAYNGIKKIYLAEVLQILAVIMGISLIVVLVANNVTLGTEEMNLESTPDMLTAAFGGYDVVYEAYNQAVEKGCQFGCFGDALLILDD